jgi:hypothetical protein
MAGLTIGKFAGAEGVGVETVRFYQRRGLLAQPVVARRAAGLVLGVSTRAAWPGRGR